MVRGRRGLRGRRAARSPALGAGPLGSAPVCAVGLFVVRHRHRRLGRRDERRGRRGRAPARPLDHAAVPRRVVARLHHRRRGRRPDGGAARAAAGAPRRRSACSRCVLVLRGTRAFLPAEEEQAEPSRRSGSAWLEPRTLAIGVMVLAFTVAEGSANDWLSLALIDGYDVAHWVGVTGYALFVVRHDRRAGSSGRSCSTGSAARRCCGPRPAAAAAGHPAGGLRWPRSWWSPSASWSGGSGPPWASRSASAPPPTTRPAPPPGSRSSRPSATAPSWPARRCSAALGDRVGTLEALLAVALPDDPGRAHRVRGPAEPEPTR